MGLVYENELGGKARTGLWEITESSADLLATLELREEELEMFSTFRVEWRQKQWLAYRALIRELLPPGHHRVVYDGSGKPYLANSHFHISVTHTENMAGVILSDKIHVGIDMERVRSRIARVSDKFLSDKEQAALGPHEDHFNMTLAWCAKEALYKLYGNRGLDFRRDMEVALPQDGLRGNFRGKVTCDGNVSEYQLHYEFFGEYLIVSALE